MEPLTNNRIGKLLLDTFNDSSIKEYTEKDLSKKTEIGKGTFGVVYKAILCGSEVVAIKYINLKDEFGCKGFDDNIIGSILNELKAMTKVSSDQIPKFYGIVTDPDQDHKEKIEIGLIFTFISGINLQDFLVKKKKLN